MESLAGSIPKFFSAIATKEVLFFSAGRVPDLIASGSHGTIHNFTARGAMSHGCI
jgi:hypothetical protein